MHGLTFSCHYSCFKRGRYLPENMFSELNNIVSDPPVSLLVDAGFLNNNCRGELTVYKVLMTNVISDGQTTIELLISYFWLTSLNELNLKVVHKFPQFVGIQTFHQVNEGGITRLICM